MVFYDVKAPRRHFGGGVGAGLADDSRADLEEEAERPAPRRRPKIATRLTEVTLGLNEPDACEVNVAGDFNDWSPHSLRMIRLENGRWEKRLVLAAGRHEYKFIVDGRWMHDPAAQENVTNAHGSLNSVLRAVIGVELERGRRCEC